MADAKQDWREWGKKGMQACMIGAMRSMPTRQQLVERLLALIIAATNAGTTGAAHGINFINEDDAGCVLLGLQTASKGGQVRSAGAGAGSCLGRQRHCLKQPRRSYVLADASTTSTSVQSSMAREPN